MSSSTSARLYPNAPILLRDNLIAGFFLRDGLTLVCVGENGAVRRVSISGKLVYVNNSTFINVTCATESSLFGNTAEFIINNVSEDQVRFSNGICYHKQYICNIFKCSCASTGNVFNWAFDKSNIFGSIHISCRMRFVEENVQFSVVAFLIFEGLDFIDHGEQKESTIETEKNPKPGSKITDGLFVPILATIITVSLLIPIFIVCGVIFLRKDKPSRQKAEHLPLVTRNIANTNVNSTVCVVCKKRIYVEYCIECQALICRCCIANHQSKTNHKFDQFNHGLKENAAHKVETAVQVNTDAPEGVNQLQDQSLERAKYRALLFYDNDPVKIESPINRPIVDFIFDVLGQSHMAYQKDKQL